MRHAVYSISRFDLRHFFAGVSVLTLAACGGNSAGTPAPRPVITNPTVSEPLAIVLEPENPTDPDSWRGREYNNSTGFDLINAAEAYASRVTGELGGKGVRIAIMDTGIDGTHPDLDGAVVHTAEIEPRNNLLDNHGTFVAGIAGARRNGDDATGNNRMGVAYAADLVDIRVSRRATENGNTGNFFNFAATAAGLDSVAGISSQYRGDNLVFGSDPDAAADIVNLSYGGHNVDTSGFVIGAMRNAAEAGTIMVHAAGNDGRPNPDYESTLVTDPGVAGLGIVVVAVDNNGNLADFSNRCGVTAEFCLAAPGVNITSTEFNGGYGTGRSGTSSAAPVVAGAAAVVKAAFPGVSPREVVQRLFQSASNAADGPNAQMGWGVLDLYKAMNPMGKTGMATGKSAFGAKMSLDDSYFTGSPVTGDLFAESKLAANAVVFDDMGFPFYANLDQRSRVSKAQSLLTPSIEARRARSAAAHVPGKFAVRMSLADTEIAAAASFMERELDTADISGSLSARLTDGVWLGASFSENAAFTQSMNTGGASSGAAGRAAAPFAAILGAADSLSIAAALSSVGNMRFSYYRSEKADRFVGGFDPISALFTEENDRASSLMAVSYQHHLAGGFDLTATVGQLLEEAALLGGLSQGAFASEDATQTHYVELSAAGRFKGVNLFASYARGYSDMGATAFTSGMTNVRSEAFSFIASTAGVLSKSDSFSLSFSQPLTVTGGSYELRVPVGRNEDGSVNFASEQVDVRGHGLTVLEASYGVALKKNVSVNLTAFSRQARRESRFEEVGAGVRLNWTF